MVGLERKEIEKGKGTFDGVGGFVLAPVAEDFVFDPGHVGGVVFIVLLLGPVGHGCGWWLVGWMGA